MDAGTKDKVTKAVIQIFSDRGLSAKTIDLFAAIDDIVNLVDNAMVIEHNKVTSTFVGKYEAASNAETAFIPRVPKDSTNVM